MPSAKPRTQSTGVNPTLETTDAVWKSRMAFAGIKPTFKDVAPALNAAALLDAQLVIKSALSLFMPVNALATGFGTEYSNLTPLRNTAILPIPGSVQPLSGTGVTTS